MNNIKITELFDLTHTIAADYLKDFTYPWEALKGIKDMILALGETLGDAQHHPVEPVHRTKSRQRTDAKALSHHHGIHHGI